MRRTSLPPRSSNVDRGGSVLPPASNDPAPHSGTLSIVSMPIGNPEDITLRALRVLRTVGLIVAEDSRALARIFEDAPTVEIVSLRPRHGVPARKAALAHLSAGGEVALVVDNGTPAVVDPGLALIQAALQQGHRVTPVPGATACFAALAVSGFSPTPFSFLGSPPHAPTERAAFFARLAGTPHTVVLYESSRSLRSTLLELNHRLGNLARIVVGCDLTHTNERIFRGTISAAVAEFSSHSPAGAYTLVISGNHVSVQP